MPSLRKHPCLFLKCFYGQRLTNFIFSQSPPPTVRHISNSHPHPIYLFPHQRAFIKSFIHQTRPRVCPVRVSPFFQSGYLPPILPPNANRHLPLPRRATFQHATTPFMQVTPTTQPLPTTQRTPNMKLYRFSVIFTKFFIKPRFNAQILFIATHGINRTHAIDRRPPYPSAPLI